MGVPSAGVVGAGVGTGVDTGVVAGAGANVGTAVGADIDGLAVAVGGRGKGDETALGVGGGTKGIQLAARINTMMATTAVDRILVIFLNLPFNLDWTFYVF